MKLKPDPAQDIWVKLTPASAQDVYAQSWGIVHTSRLIDPQTRRFHLDGLFSERTFGPIHEFACACRKFSGFDCKDIICDECGILVGLTDLRRERFACIDLALPVIHPWWYGNPRRPIELLTGLDTDTIRGILNRDIALHVDESSTPPFYSLRYPADREYLTAEERSCCHTGAEAIRQRLGRIPGDEMEKKLRERSAWDIRLPRRELKQLQLLSALSANKLNPNELVLRALSVIPAALRRIDLDHHGRIVVDPVTRCYQRIVSLDRSIRRILDKANADQAFSLSPQTDILRGLEEKMRRVIVQLFRELVAGTNLRGRLYPHLPRPLRPLRRRRWPGINPGVTHTAPVVPDPSLRIDQCRLPLDAARAFWRKRIINTLRYQGRTLEAATRYVDERHWLAEHIFNQMYEAKPTMLVHRPVDRLPRLMFLDSERTEINAWHVHPLLADWLDRPFDGSHAVGWHYNEFASGDDVDHLMSSPPIRSIATGRLQLRIPPEALLGCYLATSSVLPNTLIDGAERTNSFTSRPSPHHFKSAHDVHLAWDTGKFQLTTLIKFRQPPGKWIIDSPWSLPSPLHDPTSGSTTVGRSLLNELLPPHLPYFDLPFGEKEARQALETTFERDGTEAALRLVESLCEFGWRILHHLGFSLSMSDLQIADVTQPDKRERRLAEARKEVEKTQKHLERGIINPTEMHARIYDIRTQLADELFHDVKQQLDQHPWHPLRAVGMIPSIMPARNLQALTAAVGPISGADQGFPNVPVDTNLTTGHTSLEYFYLARRARKENVNEHIRQRDAGHLIQRIANVAENIVITEEDCGTRNGIIKHAPGIEDRLAQSFVDLITGRISRETILNPYTEETIVAESQVITREAARQFYETVGIERLEVRTPLCCEAKEGVCQKCYGADIRTGELVERGTAVGSLAVFALAELLPELRIFIHRFGGIPVVRRTNGGEAISRHAGRVSLSEVEVAVTREGQRVALVPGRITILDDRDRELEKLDIPQGASILHAAGDRIKTREKLAEWNPGHTVVYAKASGRIEHQDLIPGRNMELDESANEKGAWRILDGRRGQHPCVRVVDIAGETRDVCFLPRDSRLYALPGQMVDRGTLLAKLPNIRHDKTQWIVGGIPRLDELLSAREPEFPAVLAQADGIASVSPAVKDGCRTVTIEPVDSSGNPFGDFIEHRIDLSRTGRLLLHDKQRVKAGDPLTDGEPALRDILSILGPAALAEHLLAELQNCFRGQRPALKMDDRHLELIVGRMLSYVRVDQPGDSGLEKGDIVERSKIIALNHKLRELLRVEKTGDSFMPADGLVSKYQFDMEVHRLERDGGTMPTSSIPWPAGCESVLLGIDAIAHRNNSFYTADGYSITPAALALSAINGRRYNLKRVKDSMVTFQLPPCGSGWRDAAEAEKET